MTACQYCGAPVLWTVTEASGRRMPLDPVPVPDGNVFIVSREDRTPVVRVLKRRESPPPEALRYTTHMATCPKRPKK